MLDTAMLLESMRASMLVWTLASTRMQTALLESVVLRASKQTSMLVPGAALSVSYVKMLLGSLQASVLTLVPMEVQVL